MTFPSGLAQEWQILQKNHEKYESSTLTVKLVAISLCFVSLAVAVDLLLVGALISVLWVQEAILRTSQARIGKRLLQLESSYRQDNASDAGAFQLHSGWRNSRSGTGGLLAEYAGQVLRPTVAMPYAALLLILLAALSMAPA